MPLYEFKCLKCNDIFELLIMNNKDKVEMKCPKCNSDSFEKIISSTNYAMGSSGGSSQKASVQNRTCSTGSCTTYELPGYTKN